MKYSAKRSPPQRFVDWLALAKANEDWVPSYRDLQNPELRDVRQALLVEQEFVCCYCGRELKDDQSDSHIDHFRPQKIYNGKVKRDLTLSYENFVASCGSPTRSGRPSTCGDAKGNQFDEAAHVEPWDPKCEQRFLYGSSGEMQASTNGDAGADMMIKILKLRDRSLILERRVILEGVEADITAGKITAENAKAEIQRLRAAREGRRIHFSHVSARYLEAEFG